MKKASKAVTAYLTGKDPERAVISDETDRLLGVEHSSSSATSDEPEEVSPAPADDDEIEAKVREAAAVLGASVEDEEVLSALRNVARRQRSA